MKITTKEELIAHISAHKGKDVPLFSAIGKLKIVMNDTLKSHHKISIKKPRGSTEFIYLDDAAIYSLKDRHLLDEQSYNDNWWFTTREEAEAYIQKD